MAIPDSINNATLAAQADLLAGAARDILPDGSLDVIYYACTSGSLIIGKDKVFAELKKGARIVELRSLFPPTYAAEKFALRKLKRDAEAWFPTAAALNHYAWHLLTCELSTLRNPTVALRFAKKAVAKSGPMPITSPTDFI